ncbi:cadherin-89D [Trichonephila clavipes]|nr:cadherin-89D [Trichonephila clavipes]
MKSNKGNSVPDNSQARRLPGVHPEYSPTASGRGSNGDSLGDNQSMKRNNQRSPQQVPPYGANFVNPSNASPKFEKYNKNGSQWFNMRDGVELHIVSLCCKPKVAGFIPAEVDRLSGCENRRHACHMIM